MLHGTALRYFVEVAGSGSLAGASENLRVAVSAISRQIARLEADVGTRLFERTPRGMVLTEAGELLAHHARRSILESEAVLNEIAMSQSLGGGIVRIGCTEGFSWHFLPSFLARYHGEHPKARFLVRSGTPKQVEQWVAAGEVDLGLTFSITPSSLVHSAFSRDAPLCAVMRAAHPLTTRDIILFDDLLDYPLASLERGSTARQLIDLYFAARSKSLEPVLTASSSSMLLEFVALSDAIAIGSAVTLQGTPQTHQLVAKALDPSIVGERSLQIIVMRGRRLRSPIPHFLDGLIDALGEQPPS